MFVETQVPFEDSCRRYFKIMRVHHVVIIEITYGESPSPSII